MQFVQNHWDILGVGSKTKENIWMCEELLDVFLTNGVDVPAIRENPGYATEHYVNENQVKIY